MSTRVSKALLFDARVVAENHRRFAHGCGASHVLVDDVVARPFHMQKVSWARRLLQAYDAVVWVDADAFFVRYDCQWMCAKNGSAASRVAFRVAVDEDRPPRVNTGVWVFHRGAAFERFFAMYARAASRWPTTVSDNAVVNHLIGAFSEHVRVPHRGEWRAWSRLPARTNRFHDDRRRRGNGTTTVVHYAGVHSDASWIDGRIPRARVDAMRRRYEAAAAMLPPLDDAPRARCAASPRVAVLSGIFARYEPRIVW